MPQPYEVVLGAQARGLGDFLLEIRKVCAVTRHRLLVASVIAGSLLWTVLLATILSMNTLTYQGTIIVVNDSRSTTPCKFSDRPDIRTGTELTLLSSRGATLGMAQLRIGHSAQHGVQCTYHFSFRGVPVGFKELGIKIGHSQTVRMTAAQLADGLEVILTDDQVQLMTTSGASP
jgi:hypothetical protein